ncbi:MAG: YXWGXW repeat-containing protein [Candidatus Aquirickettsiella gammari]
MYIQIITRTCCTLIVSCVFSFASPVASAQDIGISIRFGPPAPRMEYLPQARQGYTWAEGHWEWRGRRHSWIKGHWLRNQYGYQYQQPYWEQQGNQWTMHRGKWKPGQSDHHRQDKRRRDDRHSNNPNRH